LKKRFENFFTTAFPLLRMRTLIIIIAGLLAMFIAGALVVFFGSTVMFIAIGIILAVVFLKYPFGGLLLFVSMIPFESAFFSIGGAVTYTRLLGFYILGLWLIKLLIERRSIKFMPYTKIFIPFLVWALLSIFWSVDKSSALEYWQTLVQMFAFSLYIYNEVVDYKQLKLILVILAISCFLTVLMGYFRVSSLGERTLLSLASQGVKEYASMIGAAFLSCIILFSHVNSRRLKAFLLLAIIFCIYPLFAAGERGVFLGLATGWFAIALVSKHKLANLGFALVTGLAFYSAFQIISYYGLLSNFAIYRFSLSSIIDTGGTGRLDIWRVGLDIIRNHPLIGVGLGNFIYAYTRYAPLLLVGSYATAAFGPHNDLISVITELGIIGFILFSGFLASIWIRFGKLLRGILNPEITLLATWLLGLWIYYLSVGFTTVFIYRKYYWLLVALVEVLIKIYQENREQGENVDYKKMQQDFLPVQ
jgi:O-antigen ligase